MTFTFKDILPLACVDRYLIEGLVACGGHADLAAEAYESLRPSGDSSAFRRGLKRGKGSKLRCFLYLEAGQNS